MNVVGMAVGAAESRPVRLKNPRPNEDPVKTVHEIRILDASTGDVVDLQQWGGQNPWDAIEQGDVIDVTLSKMDFANGRLRGTASSTQRVVSNRKADHAPEPAKPGAPARPL